LINRFLKSELFMIFIHIFVYDNLGFFYFFWVHRFILLLDNFCMALHLMWCTFSKIFDQSILPIKKIAATKLANMH